MSKHTIRLFYIRHYFIHIWIGNWKAKVNIFPSVQGYIYTTQVQTHIVLTSACMFVREAYECVEEIPAQAAGISHCNPWAVSLYQNSLAPKTRSVRLLQDQGPSTRWAPGLDTPLCVTRTNVKLGRTKYRQYRRDFVLFCLAAPLWPNRSYEMKCV